MLSPVCCSAGSLRPLLAGIPVGGRGSGVGGGQAAGWSAQFTSQGFSRVWNTDSPGQEQVKGTHLWAAVKLAAMRLTARPLGSQARWAPWLPPTWRD